MSLKLANGAVGKLIAASGNRGYAPSGGHLVLYGTQGTIWDGRFYRNNREEHRTDVVHDWKEQFKDYKPRVHNTRQVHHWAEQCTHFLDCIQGQAQPLTSVVDGARVVATLTAAIESASTGRPVLVDNQF